MTESIKPEFKYFLATYKHVTGLPEVEIAHFIIKATSLDEAELFVKSDSFFVETIKKAFDDGVIQNDTVNAIIYPLENLIRAVELLNNIDRVYAIIYSEEHAHCYGTIVKNPEEENEKI
jgi:hypothetical protein